MQITLAGENVRLLPERALFWERANTLLIADPHWGKAATFRANALPVPDPGADDLLRLDRVLTQTAATRLIFLGDLLHAKAGRTESGLNEFAAWRAKHPTLEITLVRGNHDKRAGDPPENWRVRCVDAPYHAAPFILLHEPAIIDGAYTLAGHIHPGAVLTGRGRQTLKLPCFWFGARGGVLPAFGSFTGSAGIRPLPGDRVFVTTERAVVDITPSPG